MTIIGKLLVDFVDFPSTNDLQSDVFSPAKAFPKQGNRLKSTINGKINVSMTVALVLTRP